jgi:ribose 5-phosphate isomerase A
MAPPRATARQATALNDPNAITRQRRMVAQAAAELVSDGMRVGLGTGTTAAEMVRALAARKLAGVLCVATSAATERLARELGLATADLDDVGELDIGIDGADQIDPRDWIIKGGGAAHTREKIVAAASRTYVVIASAEKAVEELRPPVPLELVPFGAQRTLVELGRARLRADTPPSPDGGLIADYLGPIGDPRELCARLSAAPGVVEHGLFAPELVDEILIAGETGVERRAVDRGRRASGTRRRRSSGAR